MTVIKPELTLSCLKESRRFQFAECPVGTFIVRLYWADYSKYIPSDRKLDGVHLLYDNKRNFSRICEFAITSIESLEHLVANCAPATGTKENYFRGLTKQAVWKFRQFAKTSYQFIKPIKVAVQAVVSQVKSVASKAVETVKDTVKSFVPRFNPFQPQSFAKCTTLEQAKYLFDRVPTAQKNQRLIDNYLAACDRISPQVKSYAVLPNPWDMLPLAVKPQLCLPAAKEALAVPQVVSIDDIAPANYIPTQLESEIVEHIPASDRQVRSMMADGLKLNKSRRKQWVIGVGKSIPGYQVIVKGTDKRNADTIMEQVIQNVLLAGLSVQELASILAAF